jgi:hypothetical protein
VAIKYPSSTKFDPSPPTSPNAPRVHVEVQCDDERLVHIPATAPEPPAPPAGHRARRRRRRLREGPLWVGALAEGSEDAGAVPLQVWDGRGEPALQDGEQAAVHEQHAGALDVRHLRDGEGRQDRGVLSFPRHWLLPLAAAATVLLPLRQHHGDLHHTLQRVRDGGGRRRVARRPRQERRRRGGLVRRGRAPLVLDDDDHVRQHARHQVPAVAPPLSRPAPCRCCCLLLLLAAIAGPVAVAAAGGSSPRGGEQQLERVEDGVAVAQHDRRLLHARDRVGSGFRGRQRHVLPGRGHVYQPEQRGEAAAADDLPAQLDLFWTKEEEEEEEEEIGRCVDDG